MLTRVTTDQVNHGELGDHGDQGEQGDQSDQGEHGEQGDGVDQVDGGDEDDLQFQLSHAIRSSASSFYFFFINFNIVLKEEQNLAESYSR